MSDFLALIVSVTLLFAVLEPERAGRWAAKVVAAYQAEQNTPPPKDT